ncbi:MAG: hypothetical protein ACLTZE_06485 [Evtepia sp.]
MRYQEGKAPNGTCHNLRTKKTVTAHHNATPFFLQGVTRTKAGKIPEKPGYFMVSSGPVLSNAHYSGLFLILQAFFSKVFIKGL